MKAKINKVTVRLTRDDVLAVTAAAIVNATDPNLSLPTDLRVKAGLDVARECAEIGWCSIGSAVITSAGALTAEKIIHAVGPRWGEGAERGKLASATWECLHLAEEHGLKSIALPAISTGAQGYPLENCATTMLTTIVDFTFEDLKHLRTVILCLPDERAYDAFKAEFDQQLEELGQSGTATV
ncbi:MAG TPA: macro domain-containing protein [Phototrophicaceae bacterium]|nr:macro domain-containing protein [Phototrophicaceae bacterium]